MAPVPDWARPSVAGVTLAALGEAGAVVAAYRTTVTDVGMGVWRHYYWPWYVHAHGDNVTPADPLLFSLNFVTGLALFLPVAHGLDLLADGALARWPPRSGVRPLLRPDLGRTAVTLASVVPLSLLGTGVSFNLFALPGFLVLLGGVVTARVTLGTVPVDTAALLALPYALSVPAAWALVGWVWERGPRRVLGAGESRR